MARASGDVGELGQIRHRAPPSCVWMSLTPFDRRRVAIMSLYVITAGRADDHDARLARQALTDHYHAVPVRDGEIRRKKGDPGRAPINQ
uniref:Uncharacterized protein n=1 Tax=Nonomuraea gerenzanensis TaxID=93944 RepID=A0A1M4EBZ0_9ACTN|nr:hypothetical protein BN4615_P5973 [Nonomuraea gerenzanensis]